MKTAKTVLILATLALAAVLPARAITFIKDVMLIGGTESETSALKNSLSTNGWSCFNYDLNKGCGSDSDYVYLLYKTEADTSGDRDYVTGFYIKSGASDVTTTRTYGGKIYTLAPYAGGSHFRNQKGDLNSNAGGAAIHLYYTKDASSGRAVSSVTFNATSNGAVVWNGNGEPADLNDGCGGNTDYIYMHVTTSFVTYDLTYDLAGGTLSSVNPSTYTANTATFTLNEPTRAGYTFTGWTWDGQTTPAKPVTIAKGSTGNKSYNANWTLDPYTITYDLAGGTLSPANPSTYTVNTATFTLSNPTRTGYTFAGWTGTGLSSAQTAVTIARGSTGNRTYTANWTPIAYTISYNINSGMNASGNPATYTVETATFSLNNPTRTGYTFAGWTWSGQATPTKPVTITKGTTGNKSYTANWTLNTYTITYNLNSGTLPSSTSNPATYNVNTATFTLNNPTRNGFAFTGWTWSGQSTPTKTVTIAKGSTGNKSYAANWIPLYTISYDLAGGTLPGGAGNPTTYTTETATFTLVNPTRTGYIFTGWIWDGQSTPVQTVTIPQGSTGDKSFSANWSASPKGNFDACESFANYITLSGWAYDPDEPSRSVGIQVQIYQNDGTTLCTERSLTAGRPRDDVNSRYGITGQHGFSVTIPIAAAGTYKVKVYALDTITNVAPTQVGSTKTATTSTDANIVQLDNFPQGFRYAAQDGDILVGRKEKITVTIADGATVTLCDADIDAAGGEMQYSRPAIVCLGDATLVLADGTENRVRGRHASAAIEAGPEGSTLVIRGNGSLDASTVPLIIQVHDAGYCLYSSTVAIGPPERGTCGDIIIEGGTINAIGGYCCPAIGCSRYGHCGTIVIADSVTRVTATAGDHDLPTSPNPASVLNVDYYAPPSIGPGKYGTCGPVIVGDVDVEQIDNSPFTYDPSDPNGPNIVPHYNTVAIDEFTSTVTLKNKDRLTGSGGVDVHITITDGATVMLSGVDNTHAGVRKWAGITCEGDATIILEGDNAVLGGGQSPGIYVPPGKTLVIRGDGSLTATGNALAAGIGGGYEQGCGNIIIEGDVGRVTATAGYNAPYSIGPGNVGGLANISCGTVAIGGVETGPIGKNPFVYAPAVLYTVSFNANGGSGTMAGQSFSCGASQNLDDCTLIGPSGYSFAGWNTAADGSGTAYADRQSITIDADLTLYAQWSDARRTVSFNANGGSGAMSSQIFVLGVSQNLGTCTFTAPSGYWFASWNTAADGSGTAYADRQSITIDADLTLYAQWSDAYSPTTTIDDASELVVLNNYAILTGTGGSETRVTIADGATVVLAGVKITELGEGPGITCAGDATIILVGDNIVNGGEEAGIYVPPDKTLVIRGDGSLTATGGGLESSGIGGGDSQNCGNVIIEGGIVTAICSEYGFAAGIGSGKSWGRGTCGSITIGSGITRVTAIGVPALGGRNNPSVTISPGLVEESAISHYNEDEEPVWMRTFTPATGYVRWAAANGLGAWDATDALGIHNVFRYAFGKPTGAFENPPIISISFENGQVVITTPPLVNTEGYAFSILATDTLDGTGTSATYSLNALGRTVIPVSDKPARFFRLRAVAQ